MMQHIKSSGFPKTDEKVRVSETYLVGDMTFPDILKLEEEETHPLWEKSCVFRGTDL